MATMEKKSEGEEDGGVKATEEWEIDPAKLLIKGLIARGTFGSVHRGVYDGQDVAVRLLDWGEEGSRIEAEIVSLRAAFIQEVSVWHKLDHPNVTKFIGATLGAADLNIQTESGQIGMSSNVCCVVVEYLPGGSLKTYLIKNHRRKLAFKVVVKLALDLARGLSYLHSKKIVHRDVKTDNMLLDRTRTLKIADFGVARVEAPHDMTGETGNLGYMAPEVLNGNLYNRKCDVYSFGICLWEIYCCDMPYADLAFSEVASAIVGQNLRPEIPRCCPNSLANMMKRCWDANPDKRPEMDEVVALLEAIDTSKGGGMIPLDQQQECMPCYLRPDLWRDRHIEFLKRGFKHLGPSYRVLDANRPWLCYWILHSMALLAESLDTELENNTVDFLSRCEDINGGYGGGPGQMPHLATTYAAVNALVTLGSDAALFSINRDTLRKFLLRMKDSSGAFRMHLAGEIDVRACYTAISVASMLNILDFELAKGVGDYILSCQTYEGGIAGEPASEAHGGYTFCGLATMILINEVDRLDLPSLIDWVAFRQGVECGFQGRTNKLVDGCYSFWQGGSLSLIQRLPCFAKNQTKSSLIGMGQLPVECSASSAAFSGQKPNECLCQVQDRDNKDAGRGSDTGLKFIRTINGVPLFHSIALQQYLLLCSQVLEGGFRDKPGKLRDHYHTCYCLSGLSVSQYSFSKTVDSPPLPNSVLGPYSNLLEPIHPLYNVVLDQYYRAQEFFSVTS